MDSKMHPPKKTDNNNKICVTYILENYNATYSIPESLDKMVNRDVE